jgi:hypothetical protein
MGYIGEITPSMAKGWIFFTDKKSAKKVPFYERP